MGTIATIVLLLGACAAMITREALTAAGSAIVPGHLVELVAGELQEHSTAGGVAQMMFALPDLTTAGNIDKVYGVGVTARYGHAARGQGINGLVAAAAPAIAQDEALESAGNGTLRAFIAGEVVGYASEAVDNSGGGTAVRIPFVVA